jgi:AcrR family transcriptional regulator
MAPAAATSQSTDTHRRILGAAAHAFARFGLQGATTRQIAQDANVNEVTLFRHFQTKDKLIAAVVAHTFAGQDEPVAFAPGEATPELRPGLRRCILRYNELLESNILLVRTMLGEIHRHEDQEACVFKAIFFPVKAALVLTIEAARARGEVRPEVDPVVAADLLGSMIFLDVLRRSSSLSTPSYAKKQYLETAIEVLARGIEMPPRQPASVK